ncbi:thioesterase family protein [Wenyingzhuangia sp. chi5]|uniref:Thioesterase family protein n=2 Tax=Wenyingzhuangia gilva TaxID=3057677 RepID=A0ABT8VT35_9FLAO|nr:thioesterase family protein [Wenyingzhuangia sp. chi5]MDO3695102.1 thioesterase family protein [Wenyingzhuangia sp. chi5]
MFFLPNIKHILKQPMKPKTTELRVRYSETDQMQYVHHSNYAKYFEIARIEWLREAGISYKEMEEQGIMLPVVSLLTEFKKPAKYDDVLTIKTEIKQIPTAKIIFTYEIYNQKDELLTTGESTLVFVDMKKNRPMKCPENILAIILKHKD